MILSKLLNLALFTCPVLAIPVGQSTDDKNGLSRDTESMLTRSTESLDKLLKVSEPETRGMSNCISHYKVGPGENCDTITSHFKIRSSPAVSKTPAHSKTCEDFLLGYRICLNFAASGPAIELPGSITAIRSTVITSTLGPVAFSVSQNLSIRTSSSTTGLSPATLTPNAPYSTTPTELILSAPAATSATLTTADSAPYPNSHVSSTYFNTPSTGIITGSTGTYRALPTSTLANVNNGSNQTSTTSTISSTETTTPSATAIFSNSTGSLLGSLSSSTTLSSSVINIVTFTTLKAHKITPKPSLSELSSLKSSSATSALSSSIPLLNKTPITAASSACDCETTTVTITGATRPFAAQKGNSTTPARTETTQQTSAGFKHLSHTSNSTASGANLRNNTTITSTQLTATKTKSQKNATIASTKPTATATSLQKNATNTNSKLTSTTALLASTSSSTSETSTSTSKISTSTSETSALASKTSTSTSEASKSTTTVSSSASQSSPQSKKRRSLLTTSISVTGPSKVVTSAHLSPTIQAETTKVTAAAQTVTSVPYKAYSGNGSITAGWPSMAQWLPFQQLWDINVPQMKNSCSQWGVPNDSEAELAEVQKAIMSVGAEADVDPRFILAIVLQESTACVRVITTSYTHLNPGLMQTFNGTGSCNTNTEAQSAGVSASGVQTPCPDSQIETMIRDGTMGTQWGPGLKQDLARQNNTDVSRWYRAARLYNGGSLSPGGDLAGPCCTPTYASDVANRLVGWTTAPVNFPEYRRM